MEKGQNKTEKESKTKESIIKLKKEQNKQEGSQNKTKTERKI